MLLNETSKGSEPQDKVSTGLYRGVWKFCPVALNKVLMTLSVVLEFWLTPHCGQTSTPLCCLSKGHCSKRFLQMGLFKHKQCCHVLDKRRAAQSPVKTFYFKLLYAQWTSNISRDFHSNTQNVVNFQKPKRVKISDSPVHQVSGL